jgi:hypothetical protein
LAAAIPHLYENDYGENWCYNTEYRKWYNKGLKNEEKIILNTINTITTEIKASSTMQ